MNTPIPKDILFVYFAGNASILQKKMIREWLADPANTETYLAWLQEWETSRPQLMADHTEAFRKFTTRIDGTGEGKSHFSYETDVIAESGLWLGWKWVAVFMLCLGIASYSFRHELINKTISTAYEESKTIILADSSKVILRPNSSLRVPRFGFGRFVREVVLEGEASFSVTHTVDNAPFQVTTPDRSTVTVLGTEFDMYARAKGTRVLLNRGRVQLATLTEPEPQNMNPGERATVNRAGQIEIKKLTQKELATPQAWKEYAFDFQHTSLENAASEIGSVFGVHVVVEDKTLSERELTGTFRAQNAGELLNVLCEMLNMNITRTDNTLYLTPKL